MTRAEMLYHIGGLERQIESLRTELDAAKVDAERYAWLRNHSHWLPPGSRDLELNVAIASGLSWGKDFANGIDAFIDTASARPGTSAEETR